MPGVCSFEFVPLNHLGDIVTRIDTTINYNNIITDFDLCGLLWSFGSLSRMLHILQYYNEDNSCAEDKKCRLQFKVFRAFVNKYK